MDIILLGHIIFMTCSIFFMLFTRFLKSRETNAFVGYRTPLSMRNKETWKEANTYSAMIQLWASIIFCVLAASSYLIIGGLTSFYLCSFLLAISFISVIPITEYHLRKKFGSCGDPLN